jgi:hypothetical protein
VNLRLKTKRLVHIAMGINALTSLVLGYAGANLRNWWMLVGGIACLVVMVILAQIHINLTEMGVATDRFNQKIHRANQDLEEMLAQAREMNQPRHRHLK